MYNHAAAERAEARGNMEMLTQENNTPYIDKRVFEHIGQVHILAIQDHVIYSTL